MSGLVRRIHRSAAASPDPSMEDVRENELLDLRARQRTFDGAYTRTAINALSVGIMIIKIFSADFYYIGLIFVLYGLAFLGLSFLRRRQTPTDENMRGPFRTSGDYVLIAAAIAAIAYVALIVLLARMETHVS